MKKTQKKRKDNSFCPLVGDDLVRLMSGDDVSKPKKKKKNTFEKQKGHGTSKKEETKINNRVFLVFSLLCTT